MKRPKFSLRTLLLLCCLAGAGFGLWYRWAPWVVVNDPAKVEELSLISGLNSEAPDGRRYLHSLGEEWTGIFEKVYEHGHENNYRIALLSDSKDLSGCFVNDNTILAWGAFDWTFGTKLYHRRRPEYWYGCAWLPEFWLTLAFGCGLAWSLRRDWKSLRPEPKQDAQS